MDYISHSCRIPEIVRYYAHTQNIFEHLKAKML